MVFIFTLPSVLDIFKDLIKPPVYIDWYRYHIHFNYIGLVIWSVSQCLCFTYICYNCRSALALIMF